MEKAEFARMCPVILFAGLSDKLYHVAPVAQLVQILRARLVSPTLECRAPLFFRCFLFLFRVFLPFLLAIPP